MSEQGSEAMSSVDANGRGQDLDTATASEERATHVVDQRAQAVATASRSKAAPHLTPAERAARGKAARAELRRSAHDHWEPAPGRADPVELLEIQAQTRLPELGPIRYGRMLVSPFTFFRGAAHLMASDLADGPRTGLHAQLCGDAHLSNFGIFAAPDRRLVFSINDFDETLPGPFEWDVKAARRQHCGCRPGPRLRRRGAALGGGGNGGRVPRSHGALRGAGKPSRLVRAPRRRVHPRPDRGAGFRQADEAVPVGSPRATAFYNDSVQQLTTALDARRNRLDDARGGLPWVIGVLLLLGSVVIIGYALLVGSQSFWFHAIGAGAIALILGLSLLVLLDLTYPFSGDLSVGSGPFRTGALAQFFESSR